MQDLDDIDTYDSSVINCLQDYAPEIKSTECKSQVKKYVVLAAGDIRFDVPLAEACYEDRQKFCANVPPVRQGTRDTHGGTSTHALPCCTTSVSPPHTHPRLWEACLVMKLLCHRTRAELRHFVIWLVP